MTQTIPYRQKGEGWDEETIIYRSEGDGVIAIYHTGKKGFVDKNYTIQSRREW